MRNLFLITMFLFASLNMFGQSIPDNMVLKRLNNTDVAMKDVLQDDVVILSFWATWCKPCQNELEALMDIADQWEGKVKVVAVSIDDSRALNKVKSLVKTKKWPYEVLLDKNKELYKALNLASIPYVMILDKGKTVWSHSGYTPGNEYIVVEEALKYVK